ncbi:hypothetical protein SAMN05421835_102369 [Amycolatopsis sacchari]|uniref:Uncharacterized protein n=2 Tax=Amycolatopsis sacchari TaxID=115433 RepID=A0A1I3MK78_9PSEU|nr:hypothetical protein SAMN05421835_102369 [Amycolatopsis sacchari]
MSVCRRTERPPMTIATRGSLRMDGGVSATFWRTGRAEAPGRVVAELNFGFWRFGSCSPGVNDGTLWQYRMYRAFPGKR